jgi:hypothetical protein
MADEKVYEGEYYDESAGEPSIVRQDSQPPVPMHTGLVQAHTPYVAAMQVLKPRDMEAIEKNILRQAALMGEKAAYGWGAGKGRVEGISIRMAMIMFNAFGNMTVVAEPVQETSEAWIFTHDLVDLQTGASAPRQWREGKRSRVDGNLDPDRKDAIRFNRGQSKNIRNVIVNRMPYWLTQKVIEEAKHGARDRLQKYIDKNGLAAAQTYAIEQLKRYGVTEAQVLEKMGKAEVKGLDLDDLVMLKSDLVAIEGGEEYASTLFPSQVSEAKIVDLKDKLKAKVGTTATTPAAAEKISEQELNVGVAIQVRTGAKPFTWFANDGVSEHLVSESNGVYTCNCKPKCTDCAHAVATQRFATQA